MRWAAGDSVAVRDIRGGRIYFAWPLRVIEAAADRVVLAQRPGAVGRVLKGYPHDPDAVRGQMSSGRPELVDLAWTRTVTLSVFEEGAVWVPRLFWDASSGEFLGYYVDFVRPTVFGSWTIDTSDLELDVLVGPDGAWKYKDEDSYQVLRDLGWISDADHESVEAAKAGLIDAIESRRPPFDDALVGWRWPEDMAPAELPAAWDA